ncbi:MAG: T9SS C-terminal target domain-containing protein, partial [Calditrichaeota bacterium]
NIGVSTPEDTTDDYRLIPYIRDVDDDGMFNLSSGDHSVSALNDDPYTDWFSWYRPADTTPGEAGYRAAEAELLAGTYDGHRETLVMDRMVLVSWDGGEQPPYRYEFPEQGTVFRIEAVKPHAPGDAFLVISPPPVPSPESVPERFFLSQNFPNPFNPTTTIPFGLPEEARVSLEIFNLLGQKVRTLLSRERLAAGYHRVVWDGLSDAGQRVASGIYFYRLIARSSRGKEFHRTRKMVLLH